jgi:uncharacterized protein YbjT (DUF2867 family)
MHIAVVGAHGKIGKKLVPILSQRGDRVRAIIRDASQADALRALGGEPLVVDLEGDVQGSLDGCDAVVFTAGSGGHTGADKTLLVDLWGAIKMIRAAEASGVGQFVMVSAIGAGDPDAGRDSIRHYLVAKRLADDELERSPLVHTIVRPGRLTDEPGQGRIRAGADIGYGSISRQDVAHALAGCLGNPHTYRKTFCILEGDEAIPDALSSL